MLVINLKFYASGREWLVSWPDCTFVLHIFIPSFLSVILPLHSLLIQFSKYSFNLGTIPHPQCTKALVCLYLATRSFDVLCTALYLLNFLPYLQTLLIKVLAFHWLLHFPFLIDYLLTTNSTLASSEALSFIIPFTCILLLLLLRIQVSFITLK